MIRISAQTLHLSIEALARERQLIGSRLDAHIHEAEERDLLYTRGSQLTDALSQLAELYERQRRGQAALPAATQILASYD